MACVAGRSYQIWGFSMKKTFSTVTGIMLALMMLFVSCEQGGMSKSQIDSRDLVSVSFTKVEAKSVNVDSIGEVTTPALNTLYFQYKAIKTAGEGAENVQGQKTEWTNLGSQGLSQTIQLSRGNWTISLRGFATDALRTAAGNSETASTRAVFEGSLTQDIGANLATRNENVNVSLDFTNPSGTGSYSLGVSIPASYASQQAKVKVTVTPASGDAQIQTYQFAEGTATHTYSFSTVNNGIASVKVEYLDASDAAIGDAVTANTLIMTDMTTNGSASIAEDNTFTVSFAGTSVNGKAESVVLPQFPTPILTGDYWIFGIDIPENSWIGPYKNFNMVITQYKYSSDGESWTDPITVNKMVHIGVNDWTIEGSTISSNLPYNGYLSIKVNFANTETISALDSDWSEPCRYSD